MSDSHVLFLYFRVQTTNHGFLPALPSVDHLVCPIPGAADPRILKNAPHTAGAWKRPRRNRASVASSPGNDRRR